ncbi:MAG: histidine phosphatase family protein [Anaerolineae bacterium]|nr:histidine phosphatase family protein [Anaerolineae bacterium]
MQLIFARHGESVANVTREISNRGFKHGLTDLGRRQALELATRIQSPVLEIYSSPLRRAVETAQILAKTWRVPYEIVDALREYDCGVLEGRADEDAWRDHVEVRRQWYEEHNLDYRSEGGESLLDIQARFVPFAHGLIEKYRDVLKTIVCVGHGGTYRAALPLVLTNADHELAVHHSMGNTDFIVAEPRAEGLFCLSWCGTSLV